MSLPPQSGNLKNRRPEEKEEVSSQTDPTNLYSTTYYFLFWSFYESLRCPHYTISYTWNWSRETLRRVPKNCLLTKLVEPQNLLNDRRHTSVLTPPCSDLISQGHSSDVSLRMLYWHRMLVTSKGFTDWISCLKHYLIFIEIFNWLGIRYD